MTERQRTDESLEGQLRIGGVGSRLGWGLLDVAKPGGEGIGGLANLIKKKPLERERVEREVLV